MIKHQTKPEPRCDCQSCRLARIEASVDFLRKSVDEIAVAKVGPGQRARRDEGRE